MSGIASPLAFTMAPAGVQANAERGDKVYNEFYRTGGWKYSFWKEYTWHRRHVVKRFGLRRGMRMLEVACGTGFHTNLFRWMGFDCVGVDRSRMGINWAREHYPNNLYYCCDVGGEIPVDPGGFDFVLARGCSHYHYDLATDQARSTTRNIMRYLKPGGMFIMVIVSDLSGRREPDRIWHNTLADYEQHFSKFCGRWSVAWVEGMVICGLRKDATDEDVTAPIGNSQSRLASP